LHERRTGADRGIRVGTGPTGVAGPNRPPGGQPPEALPPLLALLDYRHPQADAAKERQWREGIATILGQKPVRLEAGEGTRKWTPWQGATTWALQRLRVERLRISQTSPPERWASARTAIVKDYDLSGELSDR
jgi:hypothetical protein